MMGFLIPVALFGLLSASAAVVAERKVGLIIPFALMGSTLWVYLWGMAGLVRVGVLSLAVVAIASCALAFTKIRRSGFRATVIAHCATLGGVSYLVFAVLCMSAAYLHGPDPLYWDEMAHWGQMTKEIVRLDAFYLVDGTTLLYHNDYPPAVPLWEAICCLLAAGSFKARIMYASLWLLQCCMLLPAMELAFTRVRRASVRTSALILSIAVIFTMVCVPCFDGGLPAFWKSIYPDTLLALVAGLGIYLALYFDWSLHHGCSLAVLLGFLALLKQAALFFVGFIALVLVVRTIWRIIRNRSETRTQALLSLALPFAAILAAYASWKALVAGSPVPSAQGQFTPGGDEVLLFASTLFGNPMGYRPYFLSSYLDALLSQPVYPSALVSASYLSATLIGAGLPVVSALACNRERRNAVAIACTQVGCAALYAIFMAFMYLVSFSEADAQTLVCYERYMNTCLVALLACTATFCARLVRIGGSGEERRALLCLSSIVLVLLCGLANASADVWLGSVTSKEIKSDAAFLSREVDEGRRVLVIDQGGAPFDTLRIAYYADGVAIDRSVEGGGYSVQDKTWILEPDQMRDLILDDDYLYLKCVDAAFMDRYGAMLPGDVSQGGLYRIGMSDSNSISLELTAQKKAR